jgi:hypothetical protein
MGRTAEKIQLFKQPGASGVPVAQIGAGEAVMVMKEKDGWVLLFHSGSNQMNMGWAEKKRVVIP